MPLAQLHHSAEVTGADTCLRRPIIATAALDRSVRIWNYLDKCASHKPTLPSAFHPDRPSLSVLLHIVLPMLHDQFPACGISAFEMGMMLPAGPVYTH